VTAPTVTPWPEDEAPTKASLDRRTRDEGLTPRWWSNGPGDRYAAHEHGYHKVLYCSSGSILFETPDGRIELKAGDRLDLPPHTSHSAIVGASGVECVEAERR
jgi:quercetin dioxygenase-like cupin family protein